MDPITIGAGIFVGTFIGRMYTRFVYARGIQAGRSEVLSLPAAGGGKYKKGLKTIGPFQPVPEAMSITCYACGTRYTDSAEEVAKMLIGKRMGTCRKCQADLVPLYRETSGGRTILYNMQVEKELRAMHEEENIAGMLVQPPEPPKQEERPPPPPPQKPEEKVKTSEAPAMPPIPQTPMPGRPEPTSIPGNGSRT